MRFRLRDVFWLIFIVALACLLWRERTRTQKLAREASFYHSAASPIGLIDEPIEKAIAALEQAHQIKIDLDWPSVTKSCGLRPGDKVTFNLVDGSLTFAVECIFQNNAVVEGTDRGILIRGRDVERDGPANPPWDDRRKRQAIRKQQAVQKEQPSK
jgi:hypothetical protein